MTSARRSRWLGGLAAVILVATPGLALAGVFGGFGKDGSYLRGTDQVCQAVSGKLEVARCKKLPAAELASRSFSPGTVQRGGDARFEARARGSRIEISPADGGEPVVTWDAGVAVAKITALHLSPRADSVAVEFTTRFGGRSVADVVVIALPERAQGVTAAAAGASVATKDPAGARDAEPAPTPEDPPEVKAALGRARKAARKKRWKQVGAAAAGVLARDAGHPEARFWSAAARAGQGDARGATAELDRLAASDRARAPIWRVEARRHPAFAKLRLDPGFRRAVGIERDPARPPTAYERLVGLGGKWEQPAIPCEQARANLELHKDPSKGDDAQRFDLVIRSRCRGSRETTRLDGRWRPSKTGVELRFPNMSGPAELLQCRLELCADASGEDCLRCKPDPDIEFLLRVVRR